MKETCKVCKQDRFRGVSLPGYAREPLPAVVTLKGVPVCKTHVSRALRGTA